MGSIQQLGWVGGWGRGAPPGRSLLTPHWAAGKAEMCGAPASCGGGAEGHTSRCPSIPHRQRTHRSHTCSGPRRWPLDRRDGAREIQFPSPDLLPYLESELGRPPPRRQEEPRPVLSDLQGFPPQARMQLPLKPANQSRFHAELRHSAPKAEVKASILLSKLFNGNLN